MTATRFILELQVLPGFEHVFKTDTGDKTKLRSTMKLKTRFNTVSNIIFDNNKPSVPSSRAGLELVHEELVDLQVDSVMIELMQKDEEDKTYLEHFVRASVESFLCEVKEICRE